MTDFTEDGLIVLEKDVASRPIKVQTVRYEAPPPTTQGKPEKLEMSLGEEIISYSYENGQRLEKSRIRAKGFNIEQPPHVPPVQNQMHVQTEEEKAFANGAFLCSFICIGLVVGFITLIVFLVNHNSRKGRRDEDRPRHRRRNRRDDEIDEGGISRRRKARRSQDEHDLDEEAS